MIFKTDCIINAMIDFLYILPTYLYRRENKHIEITIDIPGKNATVLGWGMINDDGVFSDALRGVEVTRD